MMNRAFRHILLFCYGHYLKAKILMLLVIIGCAGMNGGGIANSSKDQQSESVSTTRMQPVTAKQKQPGHPTKLLVGRDMLITVNYRGENYSNALMTLNDAENTEFKPVENFYRILNLCVQSQQCI